MTTLEKIGLYLLFIFFAIYYGLYALLGGEVFIRNTGWVHLSVDKSLLSICLGLCALLFIVYRKRK